MGTPRSAEKPSRATLHRHFSTREMLMREEATARRVVAAHLGGAWVRHA
jgi:hypothetical protein